MITQAIILAGGLGTRLRSAVPDLPKCMAPILARPFIGYLLDYLLQQGVRKFILALGYKSEVVEQYIKTQYGDYNISFSVETEPLGTGGAIALAFTETEPGDCLVLNGDTFFAVDLGKLSDFHAETGAACTLALKPMQNFDRYGTVSLSDEGQVTGFHEKQKTDDGLINGGVYALKKEAFTNSTQPLNFSFETDFLYPSAQLGNIRGIIENKYFIDIGIPEDFEKAQTELITNIQPNV